MNIYESIIQDLNEAIAYEHGEKTTKADVKLMCCITEYDEEKNLAEQREEGRVEERNAIIRTADPRRDYCIFFRENNILNYPKFIVTYVYFIAVKN